MFMALFGYSLFKENPIFNRNVHQKSFQTSKNRAHKREAVAQRYSVKKVFLEISQNLRQNTCARVYFLIFLVFLQASGLQLY